MCPIASSNCSCSRREGEARSVKIQQSLLLLALRQPLTGATTNKFIAIPKLNMGTYPNMAVNFIIRPQPTTVMPKLVTVQSNYQSIPDLDNNTESQMNNSNKKTLTGIQQETSKILVTSEGSFGSKSQQQSGEALVKPGGVCTICNRSFRVRRTYLSHMKNHHSGKPFACEICMRPFAQKYQVKSHMVIHSTERERKCEVCPKTFKSVYGYSEHMKQHSNELAHDCKICGKTFAQRITLKKHISNVHTQEFECAKCKEKFDNVTVYHKHLRGHKTVGIKNYVCTICKRRFATNGELVRHSLIHNPDKNKKYLCDICGLALGNPTSLRDHKFMHANIRPYQCNTCGKCFRTKSYMSVHVQSHMGERKYSCSLCEKKFTQRSTLVIHMRHHTGEKPYKCDLCELAFASRCLLNNHKTHNHKVIQKLISSKLH